MAKVIEDHQLKIHQLNCVEELQQNRVQLTFCKNKKRGTKIKQQNNTECIGPLCSMKGNNISMSGRTDARNTKGKFRGTYRIFAVNFPTR